MRDQQLWNSIPVPALLLDGDDRILEVNPAAEAFLNLAARALVGEPAWESVMVDAPIEAPFTRARAQLSSLFVNDVDVGSVARAPMQCNLQFAPLSGADGVMLLLISPREMATRMSQNMGRERAARSAIGMADMLAHEIKNPLAGITGAAQLIAMGLDAQDREMADLIVDECRRVVKLLEQVEQFGATTPPRLGAINIHDILDRARQSASVGVAAHMVFKEAYDPSLPPALADADHLMQVFLNLIKNAAEAAEGSGTITLRSFYDPALRLTRAEGGRARLPLQIEIIDDGPGLPPSIADEVFEPFVSGRENGTGLGLALVSKLVADMGGWVSVDSLPGRTVFRVSLPRAPRPAAENVKAKDR